MESGGMTLWRRLALLTICTTGMCLCLATSPLQVAPDELPEFLAFNETIPVRVRDAEAEFDLPTTTKQDQYLLVVSSLARDSGVYSVEVTTEPVARPRPIEVLNTPADAAWRRRVDGYRSHLRLSRRVVETAEAQTVTPK